MYILGDDAWGAHSTCIAIGPRVVLSCAHSLTEKRQEEQEGQERQEGPKDKIYCEDYWLAKRINHAKGVVQEEGDRIKIKLYKFHIVNDWALFVRVEGSFSNFACIDDRLGDHNNSSSNGNNLEDCDMVLLHCPVALLASTVGSGKEFSLCCVTKYGTVQSQTKHHLFYDGSNCMQGSSGGALHVRGCARVIGWHCEAMSGEDFQSPYCKPIDSFERSEKRNSSEESVERVERQVPSKPLSKKAKLSSTSRQLECLSDCVASLSSGIPTLGCCSIITKFPRLMHYITKLNDDIECKPSSV